MMIKTIPGHYSRHDLLGMVPEVLRARGWRLYTGKGRLIDLWQYGGRAILGHNPPGLLRAIKNNAERGLYAPHPHFTEKRFCKALSALLPGFSFLIYVSDAFLYNAVSAAGIEFVLWRPFLDAKTQADFQPAPVLVPVLPCPFPGAPAVLAYNPQKAGDVPEKLPPSQILSPVTFSAAERCIYDLIAASGRGNPRFSKLEKAIKKSVHWKRKGIYLFFSPCTHKKNDNSSGEADKTYADLFRHFLDAGFLLPPSTEEPAILPCELSPGEEAKLAGLFTTVPRSA